MPMETRHTQSIYESRKHKAFLEYRYKKKKLHPCIIILIKYNIQQTLRWHSNNPSAGIRGIHFFFYQVAKKKKIWKTQEVHATKKVRLIQETRRELPDLKLYQVNEVCAGQL